MMSNNTHFITILGEGETHPALLSRQPLESTTTGLFKAQNSMYGIYQQPILAKIIWEQR